MLPYKIYSREKIGNEPAESNKINFICILNTKKIFKKYIKHIWKREKEKISLSQFRII